MTFVGFLCATILLKISKERSIRGPDTIAQTRNVGVQLQVLG